MEKLFNMVSCISAGVGGALFYIFGGWDQLMIVFFYMMILDFTTGFIKGISTKTLSSDICSKGIAKKVFYLIVIGVSNLAQIMMNNAFPSREMVILFFIANEGLNILENAAAFIDIPDKLKSILLQLRNKGEGEA